MSNEDENGKRSNKKLYFGEKLLNQICKFYKFLLFLASSESTRCSKTPNAFATSNKHRFQSIIFRPKDQVKFKMVDYGIQNSLDGIKRGIFSIWFYALFPTMSVALPYMAPESWEWDDYYMDKPRKEKAIVQFEIDQLTGK